tara:strand:- start:201 stop:1190 length:990 start_codon:yes stop_codon:yes gene_type:complete
MNFLFSHGRTAFKYGLIYLGIKKNDKIMLPEYICDVLLDPLKDLGIKPIFYEINKNFTTNWKNLTKKYQNSVKAIVVINYFGFEEEKKKFSVFCKKKNLFLIEDDCHSLKNSRKKFRNYSDVEFYSIRKLLTKTYSGGVLKINNKKNITLKSYFKLNKYKANTKIILNNFLENNFLAFKRFLKKKFFKMPNYTKLNYIKNEKINEDLLIDDLSKSIFLNKKFNEIKKIRYKNYIIWKKLCKKNKSIEIIKRNLNKNNIPWLFPVYVKDSKIRKKIFNFGWENGYSIISWPSLPNNLINKRNRKIWNKLVCFNTDRAPNNKNINFDNLIF